MFLTKNSKTTKMFSILTSLLVSIPSGFGTNALSKNYGVLCYDYTEIKNQNYSYSPKEVNLGDYIQSLAAWQFLPQNYRPRFVDRDTLKFYNGPEITMIMNSWYFLYSGNESFSSSINPIFVSYHINNTECINREAVEFLKKHEPIGCRDKNTQRALESHGVRAYFSGCLTTTLDIKYKTNEKERGNSIIFCDYDLGICEQVDEFLRSLKNYDFGKIEYTTHDYTLNSSHEERFKEAEKLLKRYARAKLVVTSRIHCALPCLALGTPVILVNKYGYDEKRFDGLYSLLNTIGLDKEGSFVINVKRDGNGEVVNPKDYLQYADKLKERINNELE